ncbi:MAG: branched-chain amino acid transport system ATP-binding protein [Kosmotogales bacterium]|nr:branched-chain amino acid transport system ATP-binding protein [Kosmotogales bacterium]
MSANILEIKDLHVNYGAIKALKGISLKVPKGEIITIIGANGAGKTTTVSTIAGLLKPIKGEILFNDKKINGLPSHEINHLGISLSPEGRRIFPELTVLENLNMGSYSSKDKAKIKGDLEIVFNLFPRLKERMKQLGGTLSGGEQQMLAIGRAMMSSPSLLMLDEPSLGLAPILVDEVFDSIEELNKKGVTILLIEQNAAKALQISSHGYVLETGNITLSDSSDKLLSNSKVKEAFLGV